LIPKGRHAYLQLGHSRRNNFRMGWCGRSRPGFVFEEISK
jgi:hypothetical protein